MELPPRRPDVSDCQVWIEFDDDGRVFRPGDKIVGTVHVRPQHDCQCHRLSVERHWRTGGRGNRCTGGDDDILLYDGPWDAGSSYAYPFIFHVPPGPYTYRGHLLEVDWYLVAVAIVDEGESIETRERFTVEASGKEREFIIGEDASLGVDRDPNGIGLGQLAMGALTCLILIGVGVQFLYPGLVEGAESNVWQLLSGAAALGVAAWFIQRIIQRRRAGIDAERLEASAGDYQVEPGDHVSFEVELQPSFKTSARGVTAFLKGYEYVYFGEDAGGQSNVHRFHEEAIPIEQTDTGAFGQGQRSSFRVDFRMPSDAPYSFESPHNRVAWAIEVHVDVGSWPDWQRDFPLIVRPCVGDGAERREWG